MSKRTKCFLALIGVALIALVCFLLIHHNLKNRITFSIKDTLPDGNGKNATVILLAGQSNASGCSLDEYLQKKVSSEKYEEYKNGYDNVYINYLSGAKMSNEFVKCATLQGEIEGGFGPELGLAEKLNELYPDETFFIIKCAWGGTNLYEQWLSPFSAGKTGELYQSFTSFVKTSIKYLISKNYNVKIEGMCWMQGESDSFMIETSSSYGKNLENFIRDIRKEFSAYAADDGIAFIDAYIAANPMYWVYYEGVNLGKSDVVELSHMNALIDTVSEVLICTQEPEGQPDLAHYDSLSEIKLGHLFAEEIAKFMD